ncbi:trypsin-like peptidase domain-containing protein [Streptomyces boncukensis]|uniref:PDZ domain-containing protein n=1 Tax=Streptomyces boncukensis TaxID=2711219 RepID=A0A6G4X713_9ACTN|nr:PDZ domain-containing protein [Streptomyces boncukensis]
MSGSGTGTPAPPEPDTAPPDADAGPGDGADEAALADAPAAAGAAEPLHGRDPYGTPPYGRPGPWALAPPVQRPAGTSPTPPHGVPAARPTTGTPPHGVPAAGTPPYGVPAARAAQAAPPPKPVRRRLRAAVGILAVVLLAGGTGGATGAFIERNGGVGDIELSQTPEDAEDAAGERAPDSMAGIARRTLPGVVTLHAPVGGAGRGGRDAAEGTGTGFVLDRRGHILTNQHVVASAGSGPSVRVRFTGGQTARGEVVGADRGYDLAVVKVSGVTGLKPLPLGNSDAVRVGDAVLAFGSPFDLDGTVTTGIVSATSRSIAMGGGDSGSELSYVDALQTDAPINPGNSGGPLVDAGGRVIGINSALRGPRDDSPFPGDDADGGGSVGLGFAIPVNQGKRVAEELINDGVATHPVIGATVDMQYGGTGARIGGSGGSGSGSGGEGRAVARGGPADRAGLREGDVVTAAGGAAVRSGEELIVRIRSHHPGDTLRLTVRRDGEERTVRVTLGSARGDGGDADGNGE